MNNQRRKRIESIIERMQALESEIEEELEQEQEYFDNMPEAIQGGEKGDKSQEVIDLIERAHEASQECISNLEEAII
jgi:hypothetical protein